MKNRIFMEEMEANIPFFLSHTFQRLRRLGVFAGTLRNPGKFHFSTVRCFKREEILPCQLVALCKNNEEWLIHVK